MLARFDLEALRDRSALSLWASGAGGVPVFGAHGLPGRLAARLGHVGTDATVEGLASRLAASLLHHVLRVDPGMNPTTVDKLQAVLDEQLLGFERQVQDL